MTSRDIPTYSFRVVAFIDILGFEQLIRKLSKDPELHNRLHQALVRIKFVEESKTIVYAVTNEFEVSIFSDSIVVSAEEKNASSLIWTVGWLQAELLYLGILTRGGIAIGPTFHKNGILYGEGMLSAWRLESKIAYYPRIVISDNVVRIIQISCRGWIDSGTDGAAFIDPFKFAAIPGNADRLACDGYDPRICYFNQVREYILNGIRTAVEDEHLVKWRWLANRFDSATVALNKNSLDKVQLIKQKKGPRLHV